MKYYLIAGEASGDLHASHLMQALLQADPQARFRFYGGDLMTAVGGERVAHYNELAYMGFIPVLLHLHTILSHMRHCRRDVIGWQPDVLILVDYPGFNLSIAQYIRKHTRIPIYYYISPKIWAWKEYRIRNIRRDVDELFSILPFEVEFFEGKHHFPIHYVGNPTLDEVVAFKRQYCETFEQFTQRNGLCDKPIIALLAGSRKQEIASNLPRMLQAVAAFPQYQPVVAGAPGLSLELYRPYLEVALRGRIDSEKEEPTVNGSRPVPGVKVIFDQTYPLLAHSRVALVTSGTATLETAIFKVPQVVCYYLSCGRLVSFLRRHLLHVRFISLVNLVAGRDVVHELVADGMTVSNLQHQLRLILPDRGQARQDMLNGYDDVVRRLGEPGAPLRAAETMVRLLTDRLSQSR